MELYAPYIPQALALATWSACIVLVAAHRASTLAASVAMLAGSGIMALACHTSGDQIAALSCAAVGILVQAIPLFALGGIQGEARTCAAVLADSIHVVMTMSMVAETTYSGAYACADAVRLAVALVGLSLLASAICERIGSRLFDGRDTGALAVAAAVTTYVMLRSPDRSFIVSLPWWGNASLTEAAVACCAVVLPTSMALYAPPSGDAGPLPRLALPVTMSITACCMSYLGETAAGIALSLAMAFTARGMGRRTTTVIVSLVVAILAAVGLSFVAPNMSNAWRVWSGTMEPPFAYIDQAKTTQALFSGDNVLIGCGVGRETPAMIEAPHGVVWPLMMMGGTFGAMGLATFVVVCACSFVTGIRAIKSRGGVSLPFLAITMGATLALGILASLGVIPDLGNHGPMFLCLEATTCEPVFLAAAVAFSVGHDTWTSGDAQESRAVALLPPTSNR
ncbi:MAG: hypothetical protein IKF78_04265 [Atopobiaceae bacterium]|nr:hypothetical protein [Atopobiaceae bacterium]